jgi:hypothetical protein
MAQRVLNATCLIGTLASLALVGLVWHQSNQAANAAALATQRLAEAQATNQAKTIELLTQSQSTTLEMLKQLQSMSRAAQLPRAPDWIPVTFKLTLETLDGPPAVGYRVALQSRSTGLFGQEISRESDSSGLVDFGAVHPGDWQFLLSRSVDEQHTWKCGGNLNFLPGTSVARTIVCPKPQSDQSSVKLRVEWPADLAGQDLRMAVTLVRAPTTFQPALNWKVVDSDGIDRRRTILYGPGHMQSEIAGATKLDLWYFHDGVMSRGLQRVFGDFHSQNARSEPDAVAMDPGSFLVRRLIVVRPCARRNKAIKGERFAVLAQIGETNGDQFDVQIYSCDPQSGMDCVGFGGRLTGIKGGVAVAPSYWRQLEGRFSVRPGQVNDWTLPLPEELINAVRQQLEAKEDLEPTDPVAAQAILTPCGTTTVN